MLAIKVLATTKDKIVVIPNKIQFKNKNKIMEI